MNYYGSLSEHVGNLVSTKPPGTVQAVLLDEIRIELGRIAGALEKIAEKPCS